MNDRTKDPSRRLYRQGRSGRATTALMILLALFIPVIAAAQDTTHRYAVEVAAKSTLADAAQEAAGLQQQLGLDVEVRVEYHAVYGTLRVVYFDTVADARLVLNRILDLGYEDAWIARIAMAATEPLWQGPGVRTESQRRPQPGAAPGQTAPGGVVAGPAVARPDSVSSAAETGLETTNVPVIAEQVAAAVPMQSPGTGTGGSGQAAGKQIRANRSPEPAPKIDGRLDDPAWKTATFASGFQQKGALRGFPVRDQTEVAFLYDDDALYVGARMHTAEPSTIRAPSSPRDDAANADRLIVSLDTYRNRQTAYNFGVTAAGSRLDYYQPEDIFEVRDHSFDPVWEAKTAIGSDGWTAEMRIPFSSLQFHGGESLVWGVNIQRVSPAQRMYAFWIVVPGNATGWASRFGDLVGISGVRPARRLAIVPYVAGQSVYSDFETSPDDPFGGSDGELQARFGGDVLVDINPSLAFEATFNPDFGQIEADPAVVNLTAFEIFFPERRPFFLEGAQLLQGQGPRYFYSRRIGAPPHGDVDELFYDAPDSTTILGAAKLIGRLPSGWSVGGLAAVSDNERARTFDPETGIFGDRLVEPQTFFGVARVQKDLGAGSTFGVVGTTVARDLASSSELVSLLPRRAYAGGADWNLRFADGTHEVGGFIGGSFVQGSRAAMLVLQGSSARYYQRPDADHVEVDPSATALGGYTGGLHLGRIEGPWHWTVSGQARSPGFEINDTGAMSTADDITSFAQVGYGTPVQRGPWLRIDVSGSASSGWNFGGVRQFATPAASLDLVWRRFWRSYVRVAYDSRALSDDLTRGGPLMGTAAGWRSMFGVRSNDALRHVWAVNGTYATDEFGGWSYSVSTRLSLRLTDHISLSVLPGYERARDSRQYFGTLDDGRPETFGRRYVFAGLDRSTLFTRLRAELAITPTLGFELYAEPFASSGSYGAFGELAAPGSRDLRLYGTDGTTIVRLDDGSHLVTDGGQSFTLENGDFDVWSFRSNTVFRWDYAQGSTLYFIWQQNRLAEAARGELVGAGDLFSGFDAPGENILAVKASFRLGF